MLRRAAPQPGGTAGCWGLMVDEEMRLVGVQAGTPAAASSDLGAQLGRVLRRVGNVWPTTQSAARSELANAGSEVELEFREWSGGPVAPANLPM